MRGGEDWILLRSTGIIGVGFDAYMSGADPGIFNRCGVPNIFCYFNDQKGTPKIFCSHFQKVKGGGGRTHRHCNVLPNAPVTSHRRTVVTNAP